MKKIKMVFITIVIMLIIPTITFAAGKTISAILAPHITIVNTGKNIDTSKTPPIVYNQTTYVPLRAVSEALGYDVEWNGKNNRIDLKEPEESNGIIKKDGLEVIEYIANPNAMVSIHDVVSASFNGEILYKVTENLDSEATATFQVINSENQVVGFETIIFKETEPGTYKHHFNVSYFKTRYNGEDGNSSFFEEKIIDDYSYRLILK